MWRFRNGSPWRDLPADYVPWQTIHWRFNTWAKDGTFTTILSELQGDAHAEGDLEWLVSIGSSNARTNKHVACAAKIDEPNVDDVALFPAPDTGGTIELQESTRRAS